MTTKKLNMRFVCIVCGKPMGIMLVRSLPNMDIMGIPPCPCGGIAPNNGPEQLPSADIHFINDYRKPV